ncbi:MAG: hypothetical protein N3A60_08735, partial [Thermanaerothrix sp.]|nr:hypothetical protein [Thermanaerothrix sp.]
QRIARARQYDREFISPFRPAEKSAKIRPTVPVMNEMERHRCFGRTPIGSGQLSQVGEQVLGQRDAAAQQARAHSARQTSVRASAYAL